MTGRGLLVWQLFDGLRLAGQGGRRCSSTTVHSVASALLGSGLLVVTHALVSSEALW